MLYKFDILYICIYECVFVYTCIVYCIISGGCHLTVTGSNFNVSSTAVLRLHNQLTDEQAETTAVRLVTSIL